MANFPLTTLTGLPTVPQRVNGRKLRKLSAVAHFATSQFGKAA